MNECKHFRLSRHYPAWLHSALLGLLICSCQPTPESGSVAAEANQHQAQSTPAISSAQLFSEPRQLTDFALRDSAGNAAGRQRLLGHWSLVFFGFTRCPDICPPTLTQLAAVRQQLLRDSQKAGGLNSEQVPQIVFISVDPEHDTPEQMAQYLAAFAQTEGEPASPAAPSSAMLPGWLGLTGDPRQIKALAIQMGVAYSAEDPHRFHRQDAERADTEANASSPPTTDAGVSASTQVSHSGAVYLLDPNAAIRALFAPPLAPPAQLYADLLQLLNQDL